MLSYKLIFISICLLSATGWAQNPAAADDVAKAINAQMTVTDQQIANIKKSLADLTDDNGIYNDPEYNIIKVQFKKNLEEGMEIYRQGMTGFVLKRASHWLSGFALDASKATNPEQIEGFAKNTQFNLREVSQDYYNLVVKVMDKVLGPLIYHYSPEKVTPDAEICGHFTTSPPKQTKKGIVYEHPLNYVTALAYEMTGYDWYVRKMSFPQSRMCELEVDTPPEKKGYDLKRTYYVFKNGQFLNASGGLQHDAGQWEAVPARDLERIITDWFDGSRYWTIENVDYSYIPFIISELKAKWLPNCSSRDCKQLRLAALTEFLTAASGTLLSPIHLGVSSQTDGGKQEFILSAPPVYINQLLFTARELTARLNLLN